MSLIVKINSGFQRVAALIKEVKQEAALNLEAKPNTIDLSPIAFSGSFTDLSDVPEVGAAITVIDYEPNSNVETVEGLLVYSIPEVAVDGDYLKILGDVTLLGIDLVVGDYLKLYSEKTMGIKISNNNIGNIENADFVTVVNDEWAFSNT